MSRFNIAVLFIFAFSLLVHPIMAKIGVGVGLGKIEVDEQLKPGIIYELPSLPVLNTGDQPSNYVVSVAYHMDQEQIKPDAEWFIFTPKEFRLEPGEVKMVGVKLNLPLKVEPGDYFNYLEAAPKETQENGTTSIGVAAGTRLYFTVVPASFFHGIYYKLVSFWRVYSPWPQRVVIFLGVAFALVLFKRFFNIEINVKKGAKKEVSE